MERLRQTDVKFVKGVGPRMAELLEKELGIRTCYDLLYHFPNQYVDRSKFYSITDFEGDMPMVQVRVNSSTSRFRAKAPRQGS